MTWMLNRNVKPQWQTSDMSNYHIAWLPGDGIGKDVMDAAKIVLDSVRFDADYLHGDIGWEFWCREGDAFPQRTIDLLRNVDAALFGAITSKPVKSAEQELAPALKGTGTLRLADAEKIGADLGKKFPGTEVGVFRVLCQLGRGDV